MGGRWITEAWIEEKRFDTNVGGWREKDTHANVKDIRLQMVRWYTPDMAT